MQNKGVGEVTQKLLASSPEHPQLAQLRRKLLSWFAAAKRDLPWRRTRDPYAIWLSEIMLQQTRVAAVIPYFEKFLARFPTVAALAAAPGDDVLRSWAGLGYYSRARNLQRAAQQIVVEHSGEFPRDHARILALPGIGKYTVAAILSIAFQQPHAVLDGNVARVLARLRAIRGELREPQRWRALQHHADALLERQAPGDWNQAMMELGATVCTPRSPLCSECPLASHCLARQLDLVDEIPGKRIKRAPVKIEIAAAVFLDSRGRTLLVNTPAQKTNVAGDSDISALFSNMWHFPAIAARRSARTELLIHLRKLLGKDSRVVADRLEKLPHARHCVTYRQITLIPFLLRVAELPPLPNSTKPELASVSAASISNSARTVSNATRKIASAASRALEFSPDLTAPSRSKAPKARCLVC